ncbi:MAG: DUF3168 domain-containing protein, partial [Methylocystis sp.]|nr:DUF3168 domain-containing protein [Methylocystis sp.]
MTTSPVIALRQAMRARLVADTGLTGVLGGPQIYDEAPATIEPPYVLFADAQQRDWSAQSSRGAEQLFALSVVSTMRGQSEALSIAQLLVDLLDEAPLVLSGHRLIDLRFLGPEPRRDQQGR